MHFAISMMTRSEQEGELSAPKGLVADLLRPSAYAAPVPEHVELRETHISRVFLTESEVFKIKKPVHFAFLDFRSRDARRGACEAEVLLNSRLAAGTYLGVVPVRIDADGRHHFGPSGEVVDWAVRMLRLPDAHRADERLATGTLTRDHVDSIAALLSDFHARGGFSEATSKWGEPAALARNVRENFAEVDPVAEGLLSLQDEREIERFQLDFLERHVELLERRRTRGLVREGHGDLRLEHIYIGDGGELTIIDCIEFNERFRCADVCADIAFLSMDLKAHGHVELAERFLARYARESNDYELYELVDFYESYRAYVRGKISTLTAHQTTDPFREQVLANARRHFALALSEGRRLLLEPVVVAVGGVIASGKSTVAEALGERLSAPVIDADRTRKHMIGIAPTTHDSSQAFEGAYDLAVTERVYAELMKRAKSVLRSGRPVILDASFRSVDLRRMARELAIEQGVPFLFVECQVSLSTCRERLKRRELETSVSDGRLGILDAFMARVEPVNELSKLESVVLNTELPLVQTLEVLESYLRTWPSGFTS